MCRCQSGLRVPNPVCVRAVFCRLWEQIVGLHGWLFSYARSPPVDVSHGVLENGDFVICGSLVDGQREFRLSPSATEARSPRKAPASLWSWM